MSRGRVRGVIACMLAVLVPVGNAVAEHNVAQPIQLPAAAEVGQQARTDATIQTTIDGGAVSLHLITSSAVTNVGGDGSYTAHSVIEAIEVTNAPASADVTSWGFDRVEGSSYDRAYAATGEPLTNAMRSVSAQSLVLDTVSMVSLGFPSGPVVVGDSWTFDGRIASDGMTFDIAYQCRLAGVAGGAYSVDLSYADVFSVAVDDGVAEGTISGTGTLNGSLSNPLVIWGGINQTIDGVITTGSTAEVMRHDTSITLHSSEG